MLYFIVQWLFPVNAGKRPLPKSLFPYSVQALQHLFEAKESLRVVQSFPG
jgi:hypothetical protein